MNHTRHIPVINHTRHIPVLTRTCFSTVLRVLVRVPSFVKGMFIRSTVYGAITKYSVLHFLIEGATRLRRLL